MSWADSYFTSQALDAIGVADEIIQLGIRTPLMSYYDRNEILITLEFSALAQWTRFPFYLLIPQNKVRIIIVGYGDSC